MAVWDVVRGYHVAAEDANRELETQARVIAEQTARTLQAVDVVLRHVAAEYKRGRLARLSTDDLHHYLRELSVGLKQIDGFGLYDADGHAVALSWGPADATMRSIADLPGFHAMRADPQVELGIANVMRADDGVWALPLGRRLEKPSGEFAGLVGARGLVSYFQDFYRDIRVNPGTRVTLLHLNGRLLARYPPVESSLGKRFPSFDATLAARGAGDTGPLRARSPIDGVESFVALRDVPEYPLAVVVSRDARAALAEWRAQATGTVLRTLALGLLAVVLLAVLARQLRRLDAAHESLRDSRERFALAVAGSDDGIWDWERGTDAIFASARARELYGLPPGPEKTTREAWHAQVQVHPDDVAPRLAAIEAHMADRTPLYEFEYRVRHPDGQYRWVRARGLCVRDAGGAPLRMAGSISDIDTRRRAEEALRVSEERFELAVAGSDVGVWDWDLRAGMAFESARAREIQGLPPGPESQRLDDLVASLRVHPDDAPLRAEGIRSHLAGETPAYEVDYRVRHDDGQYRWVRVRALCIRDADGKPYRMAGSVVDIDAQRRAEEALRLSEERYAIAMTGSDEAHWVWNVKTDELFSTPQLHRLTGIGADAPPATRSEWRSRVPMHPDDVGPTQRAVELHLAGLTPRLYVEYRIVDPASGEVRWIHSRGQCFRDAAGRPDRVAGSTQDITERKRAEEALRESEERFARAIEGANDGILDWDITDDRMFASERAMRIAGIDPDAVVRTHDEWLALLDIHPDDVPAVKRTFRRQPQGDLDVQEADCRVRGRDGNWRWVRFRGRHLGDLHGRATRWSGSVSDIDAHKRTEQALRESQERYQLSVAGSSEGMWDWDMRNETFFFSARAQELLGLELGEPMRPCAEWWRVFHYHPEDEQRVHKGLKAYLEGDGAHWEVEYRLRHASSDTWRWFRERGVALRDEQGRPYRMAGSLEDVTVRKNAEAERDRLESQLRQSQKLEAMGTLAGGIAHDFNNILAAILGYGEMVQRDCAPGTPLRRHIDAAMSAALRAKSLVERILAFSRSGVGERVQVNVQSVVDEALVAIAASLPPQVRLVRDLGAGDAAVLGDATQIHQVVMNLCANAVQAMRAGGTLAVTLRTARLDEDKSVSTTQLAPGGYVQLAVRDTGSGMAPQVLERIFDPFFTTKAAGMGTGLGLSLVHGIVADLGGGIDVCSRVGAGSTFTVYLPWQGSAQATDAQVEPMAGGSGETILLIDDEEALVRLGEEMMAELGYEPVGFASGAAALETFRDAPQRFDAVLSDEAMPEMTGSELAREIRRIRPDIPIVLMSGYVTPALIDRAREIGIKEVLAKPLAARDIARSLAEALHD
ncbi:PAS domain-containing protein [Ramlibacter monticola]|uniref:histidine kinase n=1 Tax=Ramlibacter monticola TaxID=1926872 RepID=A0A937CS99_9BURK|nr:PAS domain-containing protein [Ramlibacter monticola]MBL0390228.1 PAS domain-containing protein [Ramlibacter monticola]